MSKLRNFTKGKYYHLYSRGVEKRLIFLDKEDYLRFYQGIFYFNSNLNKQFGRKNKKSPIKEKRIVDLLSFELMPNHFHIKAREIKAGGISQFMQKLINSYTGYFNNKYKRFGSLFGTTFKDKLIDNDSHFKYLDFYIKYNCIKIIRPKYEVYKIFCGDIKLTKKEKEFVQNYPYYYKKR